MNKYVHSTVSPQTTTCATENSVQQESMLTSRTQIPCRRNTQFLSYSDCPLGTYTLVCVLLISCVRVCVSTHESVMSGL